MKRKLFVLTITLCALCCCLTANAAGLSWQRLRQLYPDGTKWVGTYYGAARECHGFALKLGELHTGVRPDNINGWPSVGKRYQSYFENYLKPGDIVRCQNDLINKRHTFMVVETGAGNNITIVDCNRRGKNIIRWDSVVDKYEFTKRYGGVAYVFACPKERRTI